MPVGSEFRRFTVVGAIGFLVDGAVLQALISGAGWSPFTARLVSFPLALSATFWLNRNWTFRHRATASAFRTYGAYTLVQTVGALINFAVFSAGILWIPPLRERPLLALAAGSGVALVFTFSASRMAVFR